HKDICTIECLPQYLTLNSPECYERLGTLAQMNPPIRGKSHQEALWRAVLDGTVDVLGSDHAPHTLQEKSQAYPKSPSGMTGVQTILPVMLHHVSNGRIGLGRLVELMAYNPARIWQMEGRGELTIGARADLTLVDLQKTRTIDRSWIASKSGWSPFEGMEVRGWPSLVVLNGKVAMRDDELLGSPIGQALEFSPS
ncbi:MAG: amidohydrolase family protein, partial [Bdellovibrionales bacterium]|nr:amidohydrolase family protein [Bdellovibrionales bacterium]